MLRLLAGAGAVLLGLATAVPVVMLHGTWAGLLLGGVATGALAWAVPAARGGRLLFVAGFLVVIWLGSVPRGEGDYLIGGDPRGYALLAGCLVLMSYGLWTMIGAWGRSGRPVDDDSVAVRDDA